MFKNYICGVDIGSSKISAVLAKFDRKRISGLYFGTVDSRGVKAGAVVDSIELTGCIERLLKKLKADSGVKIKVVYSNISGHDLIVKHSRAILPLAERGNKVITLSDIYKVNDMARILGSSLEEEVIHQMPYGYAIDSKSDILNPLGLYSHRLETDLLLISARMSCVQSVIRVINQAGYEIKDLFFSGLATAKAVLGKNSGEGISAVCDIGSDVTELLIFHGNLLKAIEILPQGGDDLTHEIAETLKIPFELAEEVKKSHSSIGDSSLIDENKEILIKKNNIYKPIKQRAVSEMVTSRAKQLCQNIRAAIEKTVPVDNLDNFIVTGRAVLLDGLMEALENNLGVTVKLGRASNPGIAPLVNSYDALAGQKYLVYLTCLGIICQVIQADDPYLLSSNHQPSPNKLVRLLDRAKEVYQEYF
ncbi:MAG: cell division protein FtsA [Candidatus Omnitrophota bacterium]